MPDADIDDAVVLVTVGIGMVYFIYVAQSFKQSRIYVVLVVRINSCMTLNWRHI